MDKILTEEAIQAAEYILAKGYCVEMRPLKDKVAVLRVIRERITEKQNKEPTP